MYEADFASPVALVMGSEEDGISQDLMGIMDDKVKIPMMGNIESLNVSVSAGVVIYEAIRQRTKSLS
jgi:23S rRNA (guanosine2251-2'-O)-methyltransferase